MNKIKLSSLPLDTRLMIDGNNGVYTVQDVIDDIEYYRDKEIYITNQYHASFDAEDILRNAVENEYDNMYEDWDEAISEDITKEDIEDLQAILNRILARNPSQNISYTQNELIEIDI